LKKGEEGAEGASEEDNVVFGVDRDGKGLFVGIEIVYDSIQQRCGARIEVSIERKQRREERKDEGEGDLDLMSKKLNRE
jgi:ribosomal protein L5